MTTRTTLTEETMINVKKFFENETDNRPDAATYAALEDIASTMEAMAYGTALPKVYLSSLDPGSGKTVTITQFVKCLIKRSHNEADLRNVGVIICLSQLEEIKAMVKAMGLQQDQYACLTSKDDINALGVGSSNANKAQVLFTTQQRLKIQLRGKSFGKAEGFYFNGRVRSVRIWDEAYLPGEGISISGHNILELSPISSRFGESALGDALMAFSDQLRSANTYDLVRLPNFETLIKAPISNFCKRVKSHQSKLEDTLKDLLELSGQRVSVILDGGDNRGLSIVSFRETLPADLVPLLVTDASGRVRHTYKLIEENRKNIVRLKDRNKLYTNVNIPVWSRGGGKSSWLTNSSVLTKGIVRMINEEPHEKWLIIYHKADDEAPTSLPNLSMTSTIGKQWN